MFPLVSLTWSIFALTGLGSLYIAVIGSAVIALLSLSISQKQFLISLFTCLLAVVSVLYSQSSYNKNISSDTYYVGEGTITERAKQGRYVLTTSAGQEYFFQTQEVLQLGQSLFVSSYVSKPTDLNSLMTWPNPEKLLQSLKSGTSFDYNMRQRMKGIYGTMYSPSYVVTGRSDDMLSLIRQSLSDAVQNIREGDASGLIIGMVIGDKSLFSPQTYQAYIDSSLVHLVAVSGGNIVLLLLFLRVLVFWIPFYPRIFVLALAVCLYAIICGADSSVIRATIMGLLSLAALFTGRIVSIRRLLAYARCGMLLYNPLYLVYDVGFLLSFSAIVGIVIVSSISQVSQEDVKVIDKIDKEQTILGFVSKYIHMFYLQYIVPTLGASMGVLPIILFFMGSNNLLGIVANVIASFFVPIVMIGGIILLVVSFIGELTSTSLVGVVHYLAPLITRPAEVIKDMAYLSSKYGVYLSVSKSRFATVFVVCMVLSLLYIFTPSKKPDYSLSGHGRSG